MLPKSRRKITAIVYHCTATPAYRTVTPQDLYQWHVIERGWSAPGYHGLIDRKGVFHPLRDINRNGAHARGYNRGTIGIALAGGIGDDNRPDPNYTRAQWRTLRKLTRHFQEQYPDADIIGHNQLTNLKACPCFYVPSWVTSNQIERVS